MQVYHFGPFQLDLVKRQLRRDSEIVHLTPKVFDILCVLVEAHGQIVEKEDLIRRVWANTIVEEGNLSVNISLLRRALGDNQRDHSYIITLPGRGYSFIAEVTEVSSPSQQQPKYNESDQSAPPPVSTKAASAAFFASAMIEPVSGALSLNSPFYISRPTDDEFLSALARQDSIVLIKGARQVGKTSMLARGLQHARDWESKVVLTDFQNFNLSYLESVEKFFPVLAELITDQLSPEISPRELWNPYLGPSANFERFWRRAILAQTESPIVWCLDEVDRLFACDFASEVFGLFRSWHNKRALDPAGPWSRLTLVLAYATEAHLFITDPNQSPFNVGTRLHLGDLTIEQVAELNRRYGSPLTTDGELQRFFDLIGGHPYLSNSGLWEMKTHRISFEDLSVQASQEVGIFSDHLRRLLFSINRDPETADAMRAILRNESCPTADLFYRLRSAGAISGQSAPEAKIRNKLYEIFLRNRL